MSTTYPFDQTGLLLTNKIQNELRTIPVANSVDSYLIVPNNAPFFGDSLSVVSMSGKTLDVGVDYFLTHRWNHACERTGKEVYGTITFVSPKSTGAYYLNYQTIGGEHVDTRANVIIDGLVNLQSLLDGAPSLIDWSTAPAAFPSNRHNEHLTGVSGMSDILNTLEKIPTALLARPTDLSIEDIKDLGPEYITPLLGYLEQIATALSTSRRDSVSLIELVRKMNILFSSETMDKTLEAYSFVICGIFHIKIGTIQFNNINVIEGNVPTYITYPGQVFENQCLWADVKIYPVDDVVKFINDTIELGTVTKNGLDVNVTIEKDNSMIPVYRGIRKVSYIAIGL